jgi:hypothetical protein
VLHHGGAARRAVSWAGRAKSKNFGGSGRPGPRRMLCWPAVVADRWAAGTRLQVKPPAPALSSDTPAGVCLSPPRLKAPAALWPVTTLSTSLNLPTIFGRPVLLASRVPVHELGLVREPRSYRDNPLHDPLPADRASRCHSPAVSGCADGACEVAAVDRGWRERCGCGEQDLTRLVP